MTLDAVDVREGRVLRLNWELGLCEHGELTGWADALIARLDNPPYALTEISMAHALESSPGALEALLGGDYTADEIVVALARVNPDLIALKPLCDALGMVANMAMGFERNAVARSHPALGLLHDAFQVHDGHYYLGLGETSEAALRRDVSGYFRRIRDAAAKVEVTS